MKKILSRRNLVLGVGAVSTGVALKTIDNGIFIPPKIRGGLMGAADVLTMASQRLLMLSQPLAKEYRPKDIIKDFPQWGEVFPQDQTYQKHLREGFSRWRLPVQGMVNQPRSFSLDELKRLPQRSQITMHICEQGWSAIAEWTGVKLLDVLLAAGGVTPEARYVSIEAFDGWYEGYDMFDVVHPQTILAYGLNGRDLPVGNGAPVRLRVERQCGYKHLKFLKSITVVSSMSNIGGGTGGGNSDQNFHWYGGA